MKILLLGANGFIGRNIASSLGDYDLLAPTRQDLDLLDAEVVLSYITRERPDVLIFAANKGGKRSEVGMANVVEDNLRMVYHVLRAREYFGRIIFLGSGAEYGKQAPIVRVREDEFDTRIPADPYGLYKYICAKELMHDPDAVHLRLFAVYGPHEDPAVRFPSYAVQQALTGEPITIRQDVLFDFMPVQDLVRALPSLFVVDLPHRVMNYSSGEPIRLSDFARLACDAVGTHVDINIENTGLGNEYSANTDRLRATLPDWQSTPHVEALKSLADFYREQ